MRIFFGIIGMTLLAAIPASAQQVDIETSRQVTEPELRVLPPPLHEQTTRPLPDADNLPPSTSAAAGASSALTAGGGRVLGLQGHRSSTRQRQHSGLRALQT